MRLPETCARRSSQSDWSLLSPRGQSRQISQPATRRDDKDKDYNEPISNSNPCCQRDRQTPNQNTHACAAGCISACLLPTRQTLTSTDGKSPIRQAEMQPAARSTPVGGFSLHFACLCGNTVPPNGAGAGLWPSSCPLAAGRNAWGVGSRRAPVCVGCLPLRRSLRSPLPSLSRRSKRVEPSPAEPRGETTRNQTKPNETWPGDAAHSECIRTFLFCAHLHKVQP